MEKYMLMEHNNLTELIQVYKGDITKKEDLIVGVYSYSVLYGHTDFNEMDVDQDLIKEHNIKFKPITTILANLILEKMKKLTISNTAVIDVTDLNNPVVKEL